MLTIKNQRRYKGIAFLALVTLMTACAPPGPRALLDGARQLERGKFSEAVEKLKTATSLLPTNAHAWNYLGLAYHYSGSLAEAEKAYGRALLLNHDLSEAHYNLGCLFLQQNKNTAARNELTAYTLRRGNSVDALMKLGTAQLRLRDGPAAEKCFDEILRLSPTNTEAWNGLGLARLQRGRTGDSVQCFTAVLKRQPSYAPALLNLAIIAQQNLKDRQLALTKYRDYANLKPPPRDVEPVRQIIHQLEQELTVRPAPAVNTNSVPNVNPPGAALSNAAPAPVAKATPVPPIAEKASSHAKTDVVRETVEVPPEPIVRTAQDVPSRREETDLKAPVKDESGVASTTSKPAKRGFLDRINPAKLFHSEPNAATPTPLPPTQSSANETAGTSTEAQTRYSYLLPARPGPGNREAANGAFQKALEAQRAHRLADALTAYREATNLDPAFFEAHYNLGLAATEAGELKQALAAYESALAIRPEALDGRYNFALVLKQAGHAVDAANELEKVLAAYPNETRAHLALGNLYAQQLHQPERARPHYLKVLETEPHHGQASAIRYWLTQNPQ
jgi:tetratricopeptide (TPR) repeat protein